MMSIRKIIQEKSQSQTHMIILAVHHLFFSSPFIGGVLDLLEREKIAQRRFPECVLAQAIDFSWALDPLSRSAI